MAFWHRINQSKNLKHFTRQLKRYYVPVNTPSYSVADTKSCAIEKPFLGIAKRPTDFCNNVRFFAAPFQAPPKKEEKDLNGLRLNDQIKAQFVRLVLEEGHEVVSMHEALERARRLKLDLVEVQRNADPPVCKIMDFHREKYKREANKKYRAKANSDVTLKKGDCKEVRFSGKIEQKDLKMKADTVKRLIERGYRVKCMALPVSKKEEGEDLGGYLSRLLALIEDISLIESGPHVERKQAYVVIRHVKFGPSKKSGKKSKVVGDMSPAVSKAASSSSIVDSFGDTSSFALCEEDPAEFGSEDEAVTDEADSPIPSPEMGNTTVEKNRTAWSVLNSRNDFNTIFDLDDDTNGLTSNFTKKEMNPASETGRSPESFSSSNISCPKPMLSVSRADTLPSSSLGPSIGTENRYKRNEQRNQFPPSNSVHNRGPDMSDFTRSETQFPIQRRQSPPPSMGERKQVGADASVFRNTKPPGNMPRQEPSRPNVPGSPASTYGIFSDPKANAPRNPGTAGAGATENGSRRPGISNDGQAKFGIFSR